VAVLDVLVALAPPVGVGLLFFVAIRALIHADRRERAALARMTESEKHAPSGDADDEPK
jgi:hypothetical protein